MVIGRAAATSASTSARRPEVYRCWSRRNRLATVLCSSSSTPIGEPGYPRIENHSPNRSSRRRRRPHRRRPRYRRQSMTWTHLLVDDEGPVTTITLNRPEKRNALSQAVMEELIAALESATGRVVVLAGAGP